MRLCVSLSGAVDRGVVRQIGVSNFYGFPEFKRLYDDARIKPTVLQNRFTGATDFDVGLRQFCRENKISYQSFWTLTANPGILTHPSVRQLALERQKTPEQLFFAYLIGCEVVPLTGCKDRRHMEEDIEVAHSEIWLNDKERETFDVLLQ